LLGAHDETGDADLLRLLHRRGQQLVRLGRRLVGHEVVTRVVEQRVDVDEVDELLDVDRAHRFGVQCGELVVADGDVLTGGELVALDDVLVGDIALVGARDPLHLDTGTRLGVDLIEVDGLTGHGTEELHRDVDQAEADRSAPNGARHVPNGNDHAPQRPRQTQLPRRWWRFRAPSVLLM
jgi:hypothetical protein